jgi:transcriptional regulator with XRE-family HTH domain
VATPAEVHRMISEALSETAGDLQALADEVGVSYATLHAWKTGRRNPTTENLARLADAIGARGERMRELAEELRKAAGE